MRSKKSNMSFQRQIFGLSRYTRAYHKKARVCSFYSRDTGSILFSCNFFVIFFYLNHTVLDILTIRIVRIKPWKSISASNGCQISFKTTFNWMAIEENEGALYIY